MTTRSILASAAVLVLVGAACGGSAAPAPAATSSAPTVAAATSAAPTPAPSTPAPTPSATAAPAYAGVGAAVLKIAETTYAEKATPVHLTFLGDEPSLKAGTYLETLSLVTLQPGGRTVSHKHGGLEIVIVAEGTVEIDMGAAGKKTLKAGERASVPANTALQARNTGTGVARFLAFFMTLDGQPFQTNLTNVP